MLTSAIEGLYVAHLDTDVNGRLVHADDIGGEVFVRIDFEDGTVEIGWLNDIKPFVAFYSRFEAMMSRPSRKSDGVPA